MTRRDDLPVLVAAVRTGLLAPDRVGELLLGWDEAAHPRLADHLAARGGIDPDALRHLRATVDDDGEPTAVVGGIGTPPAASHLPAGRLDETATLHRNGHHHAPEAGSPPGDRYRLLRLHRQGGLGQVWLALDTAVGRQVALKTLRPDRAELPGVRPRFLAEAKAAGRLEHPNIVPVYDLVPGGAAGRPDPAYVMRFVAGKTLAEKAAEYHAAAPPGPATRQGLAPLLDAFVLVCRAVAFAHSRGVLHRDLKGANIIVGDFGEVQLLDWGLAKLADAEPAPGTPAVVDPGDSDLTVAGGVVGTPAYLAPEVAAGARATVGSEVYSLGATLYALLTGRPPADGPTPDAVLAAVRTTKPPPPRQLNPAVPAALNSIVLKAMSWKPGERYPSADALARDVRDWLADAPVAAYPDGPAGRAARWGRRHRPAVAAAALLLVASTAGLGAGAGLLAREQRRTEGALAAATDLAERVGDTAAGQLPDTPAGTVARYKLAELVADGFRAVGRLRPDRPAPRLNTVLLNRYAGQSAVNDWRPGDADEHYRRAVELADADPADLVQRADVRRVRAAVLRQAGRLLESERMLREALDLAPSSQPASCLLRAFTLSDLAQVLYLRGRTKEATAAADEAIALFVPTNADEADRAKLSGRIKCAACYDLLATCRREAGDFAAARDAHRKARDLLDPLGRNPNLLFADVETNRMSVVLNQARTAAARPPDPGDPLTPKQKAVKMLGEVLTGCNRLATRPDASRLARLGRAAARLERSRVDPSADPGDLAAAREEMEDLAADRPEVALVYAQLGQVYALLHARQPAGGWRVKAAAALRAAAEREPDNPRHAASLATLAD